MQKCRMIKKWDFYLLALMNALPLAGLGCAVARLWLDDPPDRWAVAGFACLGVLPGIFMLGFVWAQRSVLTGRERTAGLALGAVNVLPIPFLMLVAYRMSGPHVP